MPANTIGEYFSVTTFGESHGPAVGAVIDGMPSGIQLDIQNDIQQYLDRRRPGSSSFVSPRKEKDQVEVLSGVFEGKTLGTPICLLVRNSDIRSQDYNNIKNIYRPSHGDYTWEAKFGIRDYRGGGRSSARETVARVAAGSLARKLLSLKGITVTASVIQIGEVAINRDNWQAANIHSNPFFSGDEGVVEDWKTLLEQLRQKGDSVGAKIEIIVSNMMPGLGEPVFDKLDAELAKALMSIPAVKSVEVGLGTKVVSACGSDVADEMIVKNESVAGKIEFLSNHSGGVQGGISNGNDIVLQISLKPTSSIAIPKQTVNQNLEPVSVKTFGRHDSCVGIRAVPIAEAMVAITLADLLLRHRARLSFDAL